LGSGGFFVKSPLAFQSKLIIDQVLDDEAIKPNKKKIQALVSQIATCFSKQIDT
jgi:hypothetical protein